MRSVLRHNHPLALYCYDAPAGVPDGVELRDAAQIIPRDRIFRHSNGSFAPFSDWFRLELQRRSLGTWIDTDVYFVRPLDIDSAFVFGEESPGIINNAVLRLPCDSRLLAELLKPFDRWTTPNWLPLRMYLRARAGELVRGKPNLSGLPWGTTGPHGLTAVARRVGLIGQALPAEVFYPVHWERADWISSPATTLDEVITPATVAVHLWNEYIKELKETPAPQGSFLHRLHAEGSE